MTARSTYRRYTVHVWCDTSTLRYCGLHSNALCVHRILSLHVAFALPALNQKFAVMLHYYNLYAVSHDPKHPSDLCYQVAIKLRKTCRLSLQVILSRIIMRYTGRHLKHMDDWADDHHCTQTRSILGAAADKPNWSTATLPGDVSWTRCLDTVVAICSIIAKLHDISRQSDKVSTFHCR